MLLLCYKNCVAGRTISEAGTDSRLASQPRAFCYIHQQDSSVMIQFKYNLSVTKYTRSNEACIAVSVNKGAVDGVTARMVGNDCRYVPGK